eukprot:8108747-Pyramimonas_sp.AAC.1
MLDAARPRDSNVESGTQQRGRQTHAGDSAPTHEEPAVLQHRTSDEHVTMLFANITEWGAK